MLEVCKRAIMRGITKPLYRNSAHSRKRSMEPAVQTYWREPYSLPEDPYATRNLSMPGDSRSFKFRRAERVITAHAAEMALRKQH